MGAARPKVYLVNGKRTPFGKFGGSLSNLTPVELAVLASKSLLNETNVSPDTIDQVIFSNVIPSTPDTLYGGRHLALKIGLKTETPGISINRLCGSGIQALLDAHRLIITGESEALLVAGAETMSMAPHLIYGSRFGTKYGPLKTQDFLLDTLFDKQAQIAMGLTAENLSEDYQVSREESDEYSLESHLKATRAYTQGLIQPELVEVSLDKITLSKDEHLREDASLEELKKLKPTFKKNGTVTAGSASGIVDGACSILVASEAFVRTHQLTPLAEIIAGEVIGVDPQRMGIGPVPSILKLLKKQNLKISDIDLFEINEAFASQVIACRKALEIPVEKLNVWGGAVALGHPLGATGLKISLTLARQLAHFKKSLGISSACIGGGQGIALLMKRL